MRDFELTKKCAEWLGLKRFVSLHDKEVWIQRYAKEDLSFSNSTRFDPLNNWHQFMEMVLPEFTNVGYDLHIIERASFYIDRNDVGQVSSYICDGVFPSDLRRAVLEMISEMEEKL